jgi:hypothetical protein
MEIKMATGTGDLNLPPNPVKKPKGGKGGK